MEGFALTQERRHFDIVGSCTVVSVVVWLLSLCGLRLYSLVRFEELSSMAVGSPVFETALSLLSCLSVSDLCCSCCLTTDSDHGVSL